MTALPANFITDNGVTMIDGLATGVLLFVIALGLSLVFGVMDVLNLAHGAIYLVGAYVAVALLGGGSTMTLVAFVGAVLLAAVVGGLGGWGLSAMVRPVAHRGHLDQALLTLGIALVVSDLISMRFGNDVRSIPAPDGLDGSVSIFGQSYPLYRLIVIVVGGLLAVAALYVIERTRVGSLVARDVDAFAPVPLLAAVVAGGLFALVTGVLMVRTKGTYFLMLTLAIAELVHVLAQRWEGLTGGTNGLYGIPSITLTPGGEAVTLAGIRYWWILLVFLVGFAVVWWTSKSTLGRSLRGLRDNEERMGSIGYSTFRLKLVVYAIAGAVAGAAGSMWVAQNRFVSPEDLAFEVSAMALLAVVVGGRGRLWGAVLGAALVTIIRDDIGASLDGRGPLLLGLVFIAVVYLLPRGFAGTDWRGLLARRPQEEKA